MATVRDNCGLFGIYTDTGCVQHLYQGLDFLQHRGQEYCGICTFDGHIRQVTHHGKVCDSMSGQDLDFLEGTWGIGHVSLKERQPIMWQSGMGEIALAFSGNVINSEELIQEMTGRGKAFYRGHDVEILSKIILEAGDLVTGIRDIAKKVHGAYSLLILSKDGIYAARDTYGFRPLILGRGESAYVVSSESRAIQNLDMEILRDVRPGEVVAVDGTGFHTVAQLESPRAAYCAFEWAYTASIDSIMEGVYVQEARNSLGARLALRDMEEGGVDADIVAPVPMSGIGHTIGYHMRSKIDYQEAFLYNRYADRSYTQSTQTARERMAKRKLSVLHRSVKGRRIILCDDSIVRGTQILHKVRDLKNAGAKEVHVRVACPPLMYPCDFGISTRSYDELIARRFLREGDIATMEDLRSLEAWIAREIEADTVKYNSLDSFVEAIGIPHGSLCLKCFDGIRPTETSTA
ncbi:amidophosphoribosyltransferase [Thermodesulfobacteriota bacterium]